MMRDCYAQLTTRHTPGMVWVSIIDDAGQTHVAAMHVFDVRFEAGRGKLAPDFTSQGGQMRTYPARVDTDTLPVATLLEGNFPKPAPRPPRRFMAHRLSGRRHSHVSTAA